MSLRGGRGDLRDWIGDHLDPLEAHDPAQLGRVTSDFQTTLHPSYLDCCMRRVARF